ncbi:MAG TPA: site-specific DNA-methyltransferase, partial [Lamprocystis sp. (in: g-proteobacteria)]|nr:site-specific DNA-methyltransferase [Lamprocystis sp. (in: g-proteobacteria)]
MKPPKDLPETAESGDYEHSDQAVQRPAVGVQEAFPDRRPPKDYRYDSSLAPELCWDENAERAFADWLLDLIERAAAAGESAVFTQTPIWAGTGERFQSMAECVARLRSLTQPFLNWSGKAERQRIRVPTIPLFVHERQSTQAILSTLEGYKAIGTTGDLFGDPRLDVADQLDAYDHLGPWSNRLVLGDSLQVMNSLLEYEGLGGQVQMIYMDPPYGVKFGSNFQPFVRKRDVKHGQDEDMIREPEMVKAYRDTWELGLHSYLTVIRDRLLLAKELLTESGSIFVQISDENLHHMREIMDEVFGQQSFLAIVCVRKTGGATSETLSSVIDYLLWYAKDRTTSKYQQLYVAKVLGEEGSKEYTNVELRDGTTRKLSEDELLGLEPLPKGARIFATDSAVSDGYRTNTSVPFEWNGMLFDPGRTKNWKTSIEGMKRLCEKGRIVSTPGLRIYKRYFQDFPFRTVNNVWMDVRGSLGRVYVVQTAQQVIQRCMLMTTDPGDLVFDPTCGSGTTAYVAEQWGRRWITCDTSRVPLALARQRLLTATFPWYELKEPSRGPAGGFVYQRKQN